MLSKRVQLLEPSATLTLDAKVKQLQADGISVVNLTLGEPDFMTPGHIRKAAIKAIRDGFTHYTPVAGTMELRQAIAEKLLFENKVVYQPSEIVVGVGTKQIIYLALQTLGEVGYEVVVPTPTWGTYVEQIKLAGATPVLVPLEPPFKLTAQKIAGYLSPRTRIMLLNSPANPTGATIEPTELRKLADLAVKRGIYVISDEIYEKILYGGRHRSIAALGEEIKRLTITVNGFSKAYAMTGWRVGYGAGPEEIIMAMAALSGQTTSGTSSVSQKAALAALQGEQQSGEKMTREFKKRMESAYSALAKIKGITVLKPEGAFYLFLGIERLLGEKYQTAKDWSEALLEKARVAVVPGEAFYAPGYIRVSYTVAFGELRRGIAQIRKFIYD